MKRFIAKRVLWACPGCGRRFRIPNVGQPPSLCPQCADTSLDEEAASSQAAGTATAPTVKRRKAPPPPSPKAAVETRDEQPSREDEPVVEAVMHDAPAAVAATDNEPTRRPPKAIPWEAEQEIRGMEQARILEYLENISRSMTFFRRMVWGLLLAVVLNAVVMGATLYYSLSQVTGLANVIDGGEGEGGDLFEGFRAIQELLNDLERQ